MKRIIVIIILLVIVALGVALYFFKPQQFLFFRDSPAYKAIPTDAAMFFEINSLRSLSADNAVLQELSDAGFWPSFFEAKEHFDSITSSLEVASLRNEKLVAVFKFKGRDELSPLFIVHGGNDNKQKNWIYIIDHFFPATAHNRKQRSYDNFTITDITDAQGRNVFSYAFGEGLLLAGPKAILVEQGLRQLNSQGLLENQGFKKVNTLAQNHEDISLYVNQKYLPSSVMYHLSNETVSSVDEFGETRTVRHSRDIQEFEKFADWSEFDINISDDGIKCTGVSVAYDSLYHYLSVFERQQPLRSYASRLLPDNTSLFVDVTFSDYNLFSEKLENYFTNTGQFYKREVNLKTMGRQSRTDIKVMLGNIVSNTVIMAYTTIPDDPSRKSGVIVVPVKNRNNAEGQILQMLKNYAEQRKAELSDYSVTIDNARKHYAYKFPFPSLPGEWLGKPFYSVKANYVGFWENNVVFATGENELAEYYKKMSNGEFLSKNGSYQKFMQNADSRANINVFVDIAHGFPLGKELLESSLFKKMTARSSSLKKFRYFNWQISYSKKETFHNNVSVSYGKIIQSDAKALAKSSIGSKLAIAPKIVRNPADKQRSNIVVQDQKNVLYLLSTDGDILWKRNLASLIMSEIYPVNSPKNGDLQFLFNTKSTIFLLDKDGNDVSPFPVPIPSEASNGIAVFDYDNKRNYRIFLADKENHIKVYDITGKQVSGWKFDKTESEVTTPVQYFKVAGNDYLVFKDKNKIYILNRQGESRVEPKATFENSANPLILSASGKAKIIATDKKGTVYNLFLDGAFESVKAGSYSAKHFFTAADFDGDGSLEFIFADGDQLTVTDEKGEKRFSQKIKGNISFCPIVFSLDETSKKIALYSEKGGRIYLFHHDGAPFDTPWLKAGSPFTVGKLNSSNPAANLITGDGTGQISIIALN
ncbi:MAG: hypothetical protein FWG22_00120 [Prolixibacteraceae bacterium]|nr:hypothetical protein [Prolixibacteraceae bacterium]